MSNYVSFEGDPDVVHYVAEGQGWEFTLCGLAFDIETDEPHYGEMVESKKKHVNCANCIRVIDHVMNARVLGPEVKPRDL